MSGEGVPIMGVSSTLAPLRERVAAQRPGEGARVCAPQESCLI
jgi:hypothetical protein